MDQLGYRCKGCFDKEQEIQRIKGLSVAMNSDLKSLLTSRNAEIERAKARLESLREILKVQCSHGNWNYDSYMRGLANGLILAEHTMSGNGDPNGPKYLKAPKVWLKDIPKPKGWKPETESSEKPAQTKEEL